MTKYIAHEYRYVFPQHPGSGCLRASRVEDYYYYAPHKFESLKALQAWLRERGDAQPAVEYVGGYPTISSGLKEIFEYKRGVNARVRIRSGYLWIAREGAI